MAYKYPLLTGAGLYCRDRPAHCHSDVSDMEKMKKEKLYRSRFSTCSQADQVVSVSVAEPSELCFGESTE